MSDPTTPAQGPVYVWDYGMTDRQRDWIKGASRAQVAAFMLSAPLRVACQHAITKGGKEIILSLPTVHGIPVAQPTQDADAAFRAGQAQLEHSRCDHAEEPVTLDPVALGIASEATDEYADPTDRERLLFEEAVRGLEALAQGRDPGAGPGLDA